MVHRSIQDGASGSRGHWSELLTLNSIGANALHLSGGELEKFHLQKKIRDANIHICINNQECLSAV